MLCKRLKISGHKLVIQPILINKFWMSAHKDFLSAIWPPVCVLQTHQTSHLGTAQLHFFVLLDHRTLQSWRVSCTYRDWSDSRMDILARELKQKQHSTVYVVETGSEMVHSEAEHTLWQEGLGRGRFAAMSWPPRNTYATFVKFHFHLSERMTDWLHDKGFV